MSPKANPLTSISCIIRVSEDTKSAALPLGMTLAGAAGAYLGTTLIAPKAHVPFALAGSTYVAPMMADLNQRAMSEAERILAETEKEMAAAGISGHVGLKHAVVDEGAAQAVRAARTSDLIVVDQPSAILDVKGLVLEEALFHSGRPILVASPRCPPKGVFQRVIMAWDGSPHAARAVGDALALFPSISYVEIMVVTGEKPLDKMLPGADLAHHLARKGIEAKLLEITAKGQSVGDLIDKQAVDTGADMIVMGGFGHSRLRQFLFGGVTVDLTQNAHVPLFMAY